MIFAFFVLYLVIAMIYGIVILVLQLITGWNGLHTIPVVALVLDLLLVSFLVIREPQ